MTKDTDKPKEHFPNRTLSLKRRSRSWLGILGLSPGESRVSGGMDTGMAPLIKLSASRAILFSIVIHLAFIGITSIGFIIRCVKAGTLHPADVAAQAEGQPASQATNATTSQPESAPESAATREKSPLEKEIEEKSFERPTDTDIELEFKD